MQNGRMKELLEAEPIIAAIKDDEGLKRALKSQCRIVFVQYGNLYNIVELVSRLKDAGKTVFLHLDLIEGLSGKEIVLEYIVHIVQPYGIISTKTNLVKAATEQGLPAILRFFLVDSRSLSNLQKQCLAAKPDCVEIMPGYSKKGIRWAIEYMEEVGYSPPLIASGMVCTKQDIVNALSSGATAISTTNHEMWDDI